MHSNEKKGAGGKPQPFIPAGNGKKSGEYTNKSNSRDKTKEPVNINDINCNIVNSAGKHNFLNSKLVGKVNEHFSFYKQEPIPTQNKPNSVVKKIVTGYVVTERYYNNEGDLYLDIDYTCHGNPIRHSIVPHIHKWTKDKDGSFHRGEMEEFQ